MAHPQQDPKILEYYIQMMAALMENRCIVNVRIDDKTVIVPFVNEKRGGLTMLPPTIEPSEIIVTIRLVSSR